MLVELCIRDLALIDNAELALAKADPQIAHSYAELAVEEHDDDNNGGGMMRY